MNFVIVVLASASAKMRTFAPALLIAYSLLGAAHPAVAADKIKIEIVETTMTVGLVPRTNPGTPEHINTHCNNAGTDCDSTVIPATNPISSLLPDIPMFEAKAIFPDGSHVELICFPHSNKKCKGIVPVGGTSLNSVKCFMDFLGANVNAPAVATTKNCTETNLGFYEAKSKSYKSGTDLVIYAPKGNLSYQIKGSW
jgi:hypothetical protein